MDFVLHLVTLESGYKGTASQTVWTEGMITDINYKVHSVECRPLPGDCITAVTLDNNTCCSAVTAGVVPPDFLTGKMVAEIKNNNNNTGLNHLVL